MSILENLQATLAPLEIQVETGVFKDHAPDQYIVVVPLADTFELHADNKPGADVQNARISLFCKGSYTKEKNAIVRALLGANFTITDRRYIGYETETGYFHYAVDVFQIYDMED